jgi:DnaJ-class molecular chaperone
VSSILSAPTMSRHKNQDLICPECKGRGHLENESYKKCDLCLGTGFATDEDDFQHLYRYQDDWR